MTAEDLVRRFEGCRLVAYRDIAQVWTIGFGHTGKDVYAGLVWSQAQADDELHHDLSCAEALLVTYSPAVAREPDAFAALTDFVFNLGIGNYRSSTLCERVNAADWAGAKAELLKWDHSNGQVVEGLLARRQAEAALVAA